MKPWTAQELKFIDRNKDLIESDNFDRLKSGMSCDWETDTVSKARIWGGLLRLLGSEEFFRRYGKDLEHHLFRGSDTIPDRVAIPEGVLDLPIEMFACSTIDEVLFPSTLETIGNGCFRDSEIIRVEFPEPLSDINGGAFHNCRELKEILFNGNLQFICLGAFQNCISLKQVIIPKCIEIQENAFHGCRGLEKVVIGECGSLHHNAFGYCDKLKIVYITNLDKIYGDPFEYHNKDLTIVYKGNVYTPDEFCELIRLRG